MLSGRASQSRRTIIVRVWSHTADCCRIEVACLVLTKHAALGRRYQDASIGVSTMVHTLQWPSLELLTRTLNVKAEVQGNFGHEYGAFNMAREIPKFPELCFFLVTGIREVSSYCSQLEDQSMAVYVPGAAFTQTPIHFAACLTHTDTFVPSHAQNWQIPQALVANFRCDNKIDLQACVIASIPCFIAHRHGTVAAICPIETDSMSL